MVNNAGRRHFRGKLWLGYASDSHFHTHAGSALIAGAYGCFTNVYSGSNGYAHADSQTDTDSCAYSDSCSPYAHTRADGCPIPNGRPHPRANTYAYHGSNSYPHTHAYTRVAAEPQAYPRTPKLTGMVALLERQVRLHGTGSTQLDG